MFISFLGIVAAIIFVGAIISLSKAQRAERERLATWGVGRAMEIAAAQKWVSPYRLRKQCHLTKASAQFVLQEACNRGVLIQAVDGRFYLSSQQANRSAR